jgi:hypothetical protein
MGQEESVTKAAKVGAIDPNRPLNTSITPFPDTKKGRDSGRPIRREPDHSTHYAARFGATFFITICCESRVANQLCRKVVARALFETARRYDAAEKWYLKVLLLMPDHLHMLVGILATRAFQIWSAILSGLPPRSRGFNGSETFSITDCGTMKAKSKNLSISAKIRCGQA